MKQTYVFATDGSDPALAAESYIRDCFDPDRIHLTVVSVTERLPPGLLKEGESLTARPETIRNALTDQVRESAAAARTRLVDAGFDVELSLLAGDPGEEICEYARRTDADGIVVGPRGRGEITEFLIGSVSQYVIHHAPTPVIIVPADYDE